MTKLRLLFAFAILALSIPVSAQENTTEYKDGYISDELTIFMHAGPGTNYRILGTVTAGSQVKVTEESDNGYTKIIDERGRNTWVETKHISAKPGLRFVVAELNTQLANKAEAESHLSNNISSLENSLNASEEQNRQLNNRIAELNNDLSTTKAKLKNQDTAMQKEWFFNGAIVLIIGLILGLVLPRLSTRKRASMDSWK